MTYKPIPTELGYRMGMTTGLDTVKKNKKTTQSVPETEFLSGENSNKRRRSIAKL
jgi:hypothetical protein